MFKGSGAAVQKACGRSRALKRVQELQAAFKGAHRIIIFHTESTENLIAMRIVRIERIFICPAEMVEMAEIMI